MHSEGGEHAEVDLDEQEWQWMDTADPADAARVRRWMGVQPRSDCIVQLVSSSQHVDMTRRWVNRSAHKEVEWMCRRVRARAGLESSLQAISRLPLRLPESRVQRVPGKHHTHMEEGVEIIATHVSSFLEGANDCANSEDNAIAEDNA